MSEAVAYRAPPLRARHCADRSHLHGGRGYGLCYERGCDCITARVAASYAPTNRTLTRHAARAFAALTPAERERWAARVERWQASGLTLHEYATEADLDEKLLWRVWRSLPAVATGGGGGSAMSEAVALPVVRTPADTFRCEHYRCVLAARACVNRQEAVAKSVHGRALVQHAKGSAGRTAHFNAYCTSGDCAQGAAVQKQLRGQYVEPPRPVDHRGQSAAKKRAQNHAARLGENMPDPFLRRVAQQRDEEQTQESAIDAEDDRRSKFLSANLKLKCATPGCMVRPSESSAAKGDLCGRCRRKAGPSPAPHIEVPAPTPAEEKVMEEKHCPVCDKKLRSDNRKGYCNTHVNQGDDASKWRLKSAAYEILKAKDINVPEERRPSGSGGRVAKPALPRPPRVAPPAATNSDPGATADEFERMRRIVEDFMALSREGRSYVSGRISSIA